MVSERQKQKIIRKKMIIKRMIFMITLLIILLVIIIVNIVKLHKKSKENTIEVSKSIGNKQSENTNTNSTNVQDQITNTSIGNKNNTELGWELTLVNYENKLPEDYEFTLARIDQYREFDSRAIKYLDNMMNDIRKDGISNIWIQSSYRSVEEQQKVYDDEMELHRSQGKTKEEAQILTEQVINKPGYSEHNLGLAVDFNYVDQSFKDTKAYKWLMENAEDYGFILRYPEEKESITKVDYEPWHWRYVGEENAKKINELNMCLEEYIDYLTKQNQ